MLNSEGKNILTLVLSEKKILNETKSHNPPPSPCKLNGRSHNTLHYLGAVNFKQIYLINHARTEIMSTGRTDPVQLAGKY